MAETVELSESALSLLRRRVEGNDDVTEENRPAYRELAAAGIMYPLHTFTGGDQSAYRFTEKGWARRFELIATNPDPSPVAAQSPRG